MEGMMDEKKTTGRDTDAEEDVFGSAVCSGKMWETSQDAQTNKGKEGRDNERGGEKVRQTETQPRRLTTDLDCTHFSSNPLKRQKENKNIPYIVNTHYTDFVSFLLAVNNYTCLLNCY